MRRRTTKARPSRLVKSAWRWKLTDAIRRLGYQSRTLVPFYEDAAKTCWHRLHGGPIGRSRSAYDRDGAARNQMNHDIRRRLTQLRISRKQPFDRFPEFLMDPQ